MRVAVLADIHGNLPALEAVLADVEQVGADRTVVLGDLADRGPFPHGVVERVREAHPVTITGDNDLDVLAMHDGKTPDGLPANWRDSHQFAPLRWTAEHLTADDLAYLASRPEEYVLDTGDEPTVRFVHGSPRRVDEAVFPDREPHAVDMLRLVREDVLVVGHIHEPWVVRDGERMALNPGSVGQPFNGDPRAQYTLLVGRAGRWHVEQRAVTYDIERTRQAFETSGYLREGGALARACLETVISGANHITPFVRYAYQLASQRGCANCRIVPDDVWEEAAATWDWNGVVRER